MGTLYFVRHGQAAFLTDNYDRLSELGHRQGACLGTWWADQGMAVDAVFSGPGERHKDTAHAVAKALAERGQTLPAYKVLPGLHEFAWEELLRAGTNAAADGDAELKPHVNALASAESYGQKHRAVQNLMEALTLRWAHGEIGADDLETWTAFQERVNDAIDTMITDADKGARIAAFSSGGAIAIAMQRALDLSAKNTLELIWTLRNAAVVEFLFTHDRFSLGAFNSAPHLPTADLWTFR